MKNSKQKSKKYNWHAGISSDGTLDLSLYFAKEKFSQSEKKQALASALTQSRNFMLKKGYLPPDTRFMSPTDLAKEYGSSRQYWEKLLKEGKIPYKETSAGMITVDLWVQGYLNNKERVNKYIRNLNRVVRTIKKNGERSGKIECPECKEKNLSFSVNVNNINGLCRSCGFHIHTTR